MRVLSLHPRGGPARIRCAACKRFTAGVETTCGSIAAPVTRSSSARTSDRGKVSDFAFGSPADAAEERARMRHETLIAKPGGFTFVSLATW